MAVLVMGVFRSRVRCCESAWLVVAIDFGSGFDGVYRVSLQCMFSLLHTQYK